MDTLVMYPSETAVPPGMWRLLGVQIERIREDPSKFALLVGVRARLQALPQASVYALIVRIRLELEPRWSSWSDEDLACLLEVDEGMILMALDLALDALDIRCQELEAEVH